MAPTPALRVRPAGSFIKGPLPAGCAMCEKGVKMVLFVTGVCHYKCFYCPISDEKRMSADTWANERRVKVTGSQDELDAIAEEARSIGARGTGITGGDPMYDPERTLRYVRFLKAEFGPKHHVHMYTQIPFDARWLRPLAEAGLDEIRFHPPDEIWTDVDGALHGKYAALYREAKKLEEEGLWDVGFEIPCIPGSNEPMAKLIGWLVANGIRFINVNEMEFSETNYPALLSRGYRILDDVTMRVQHSEAVARDMIERFKDAPISIHFCSSPFKDKIQLRERLKRRARSIALPHEEITEDGTLVRGVIECPDPRAVVAEIAAAFEIPPELIHVRPAGEIGKGARNPDEREDDAMATTGRSIALPVVHASKPKAPPRDRLEVAPWVLEEIAEHLPYPCHLSEVYPTHDELEVERTPLNGTPGLPR
jgi:pyruvate formate-lyase activating enzyme-like uncharacterized protein